MEQLPALIRVFSYLSLLTIGGGMAAFPELRHLTVDVHQWLTFKELVHLYTIGQMAPGPNMMMVAAIGQWVAGPIGALVVIAAFFVPSAFLTLMVGRIWNRLGAWPWRASIQHGLAPVSIGLLFAGVISIGEGVLTSWVSCMMGAVVFAILMSCRINPLYLMGAAAMVGAVAF